MAAVGGHPVGAARGFVRDLRAVVRRADYRKLLATQLASRFGDGVLLVAAAAYLLFDPNRQATAADYAITGTILFLPYSLVGPFAGIVLDRWQRRQVLLVSSVVRAGLTGTLAALIPGGMPDWLFAALMLTVLGLNRFFAAGQGASIPRVVPISELVMANSVTPTLGTIVFAVGSLVGVTVRQAAGGAGTLGEVAIVVLAAAAFAGSAALMLRLPRTRLGPDSGEDVLPAGAAVAAVVAGLAAAVRHLARRYPAGWALLVMGAHRFAFGFVSAQTIVLYRNHFHEQSDVDAALAGIAVAGTAVTVGLGLAVLLTPIVTRRFRKERWMVQLLMLGAAAMLLPAALLTEWAFITASLLLGLSTQGVKICVDSLVQTWVDDDVRGRAFSLYDMLYNMALVTSAITAALVLPADGNSPAAFIAIGAVMAATAVLYGRATSTPRYRGLRTPKPAPAG